MDHCRSVKIRSTSNQHDRKGGHEGVYGRLTRGVPAPELVRLGPPVHEFDDKVRLSCGLETVLHADESNCGCTARPDGGVRNGGRSEIPDPEDTQPGIRCEVGVGGGTGRPTDRGVRPTVGVQRLDTHRRRAA